MDLTQGQGRAAALDRSAFAESQSALVSTGAIVSCINGIQSSTDTWAVTIMLLIK